MLMETARDDGHHSDPQWGCTQAKIRGEGRAGENVFFIQCRARCGRAVLKGTRQHDGQLHLESQWGVHLGLLRGGG